MAPLIDDARALRGESARLRRDAVSLRLATREQVRTSWERRAAADERCARLHGALDAPQPSPWSGLLWRRHDRELERVLVSR